MFTVKNIFMKFSRLSFNDFASIFALLIGKYKLETLLKKKFLVWLKILFYLKNLDFLIPK